MSAFVKVRTQRDVSPLSIRTGLKTQSATTSISMEMQDWRYVYIFTDKVKVAIDVSSEYYELQQNDMRFLIPKFLEMELIYFLYRKNDRAEAAKLLRGFVKGTMFVDEALEQFVIDHPKIPASADLTLADLRPLANNERGMKLFVENSTVTISAKNENELLTLLKDEDTNGMVDWFQAYLTSNGYNLASGKKYEYAVELTNCYMHYQGLAIDGIDPFFSSHLKKSKIALAKVLCFLIALTILIIYLFPKLF